MKLSVSLTGCHLDINPRGGLKVYLSDGDFFILGMEGWTRLPRLRRDGEVTVERWRGLPWVWRDGEVYPGYRGMERFTLGYEGWRSLPWV